MDGWDDNMQSQCADSFCKQNVVKLMSEANALKLLDETLNTIINSDINNEVVSSKNKTILSHKLGFNLSYLKDRSIA